MTVVTQSRIRAEFTGWSGMTLFEFDNGQAWRQARYQYFYRYRYRPKAKVIREGGRHFLEIDGIDRRIEVRRER